MTAKTLYELHAACVKNIKDAPQFNWTVKFDCESRELRDLVMPDVEDEASIWRSESVPADFYFTHAEHYGDGVKHIIQELTDKPTSNRALYSLICQNKISNSGDRPIPSFMTLQCQISDETLYCTCYFRALEVSRFFKINLEEIRQTLVEISDAVPGFSKISLTIFAFRAYVDMDRAPLKRPRLEVMPEYQLVASVLDAATQPVKNLDRMLKELREAVTAVSPAKLISLRSILSMTAPGIVIPKQLKDKLFLEELDLAIEATRRLEQLRRKQSHGVQVEDATKSYQSAIDRARARLNV